MGRGSDTRLYNSRSESSTMVRYNDGYESRYNPGDPEYLDAEKEKKQKEQDKQEQMEVLQKEEDLEVMDYLQ